MPDHQKNAKDQRETALRNKRTKWKAHRTKEDLLWILGDERGRRFLYHLMVTNGLYKHIPVGSALTHAEIGKLDVVLWLREHIKDNRPEVLAAMETEYEVMPEEVTA